MIMPINPKTLPIVHIAEVSPESMALFEKILPTIEPGIHKIAKYVTRKKPASGEAKERNE